MSKIAKNILQMDDLESLNDLESLILKKRPNLFKMPSPSEGAVFIISGGLDSTIALFKVINELDFHIYPLYIKRGARAEIKELASVKHYLELYKSSSSKVHNLEVLDVEIPPKKYKQYFSEEQLKSVGHTMRNSMLQSYALQYAVAVSNRDNRPVKTVFTSLVEDDEMPHCRLVALRAETILACIDANDWSWQVTSPLLEDSLWGWMNKSELIDYAFENGLTLDKTYSCTDQGEIACGKCSACTNRINSFKKSHHRDPIKYSINIMWEK